MTRGRVHAAWLPPRAVDKIGRNTCPDGQPVRGRDESAPWAGLRERRSTWLLLAGSYILLYEVLYDRSYGSASPCCFSLLLRPAPFPPPFAMLRLSPFSAAIARCLFRGEQDAPRPGQPRCRMGRPLHVHRYQMIGTPISTVGALTWPTGVHARAWAATR